MQVQLHGGKLRGASEASYKKLDALALGIFGDVLSPGTGTLPPYYPQDPALLKDWSTYLDTVRITDYHVGLVMERLQSEGLLENTLVVFFTDHGISHARGKQFLYNEGTHIPLVLRGPGIPVGATRPDLVEHIDIAALSLAAAGIPTPSSMQGRDILGEGYSPKEAVFAARDRCGEAADRIRSVRTDKYLYIRNFYPKRPYLMPSNYKDSKVILQRLRELHGEGKLQELSEKLLFAPERPPEELYLYGEDPWQTRNLAGNCDHKDALLKHRKLLDDWMIETNDPGPESPEVYQMEIDDQLKSTRNPKSRETYRNNSELYKKWAKEGK
jgi:arylsulfatase A-like enzyme